MSKKVSRRKFLKNGFGLLLGTVGASAGGLYYAKNIEPRRLSILTHDIIHPTIPDEFVGLKMIQFSDTHLGFQYNLEQLGKLITIIQAHQPDILFFTGDLLDEPNKYTNTNEVISLLKKLEAPFGKFAVYGNHDHGGYGSTIYKNVMIEAGFTLLCNEAVEINNENNSSIYIIGIDDAMLGKPDIAASVKDVPAHSYKILLSHAPDLADKAVTYGIQLQLSGHSHGGQIKLPLVGDLVKAPFAENYTEGFYEIEGNSPLTLYVNRGLGTTRLPFRFLTTPELTIFTLKKGSEQPL